MTFYALVGLLAACSKAPDQGVDEPADNPQITEQISSGFTLSGHITAFQQNAVDSDVNDPNAPYTANDPLLSQAQTVANPVTIGGYVNLPGQGADGRSKQSGDNFDIYQADLLADQIIRLHVSGDPDLHDLDLYLYDSHGSLVDASADIGEIEWLRVAAAGSYFIVV